jgi:hypothetical protein
MTHHYNYIIVAERARKQLRRYLNALQGIQRAARARSKVW